ncbi:MAG: DMT family transporter [Eubacteriales bacterium]|nr:DMT family transporter [Eubacteriales bacterium]
MKTKLAVVTLWAVTMIWGCGFVLSDIALRSLNPAQFMFLRFLIATAVMGLFNLKKLRHITPKEWRYGLTLGVILFLSFYLQTAGLKYTTPSKNAFLTALYVVFVPFFAFLIERRRIGKLKIVCALMAVTGSGVMSLTSDFHLGVGDSLTVACAVAFALQIYLTDLYVRSVRVEVLVFLQMAVTMCCSFLFALPTGIALPADGIGVVAVLASGIFATSLCYFMQTWSQQYVGETTSAIILSLESIFGMLFSVWLVHEPVTPRMVAGGAIIMAAVFLSVLRPTKVSTCVQTPENAPCHRE